MVKQVTAHICDWSCTQVKGHLWQEAQESAWKKTPMHPACLNLIQILAGICSTAHQPGAVLQLQSRQHCSAKGCQPAVLTKAAQQCACRYQAKPGARIRQARHAQ